jgi:diacylglycerol O-acyltransferase / wax synthase
MRSSIDRLTALDQLMLRASKVWPQDIGALALLDGTDLLEPTGRFRIEAVREAIASRLHLVPRFRQLVYVPRRGLGGPLWVDAPAFDLSEHVHVLPLAAPGGEAELLLATERLRRKRLDPSRPLWEMWFLTGLPNNQIGLFVKLHHAIADGMAAMTTVAAFLNPVPDAPTASAHPWTPTRPPSARALLADNLLRHAERLAGAFSVLARPRGTLRRLRGAWPATRELLAEAPAPKTSLDRMVGPDRNLALIRSDLDLVKEVAHAHAATVNDVLLAVTAGGPASPRGVRSWPQARTDRRRDRQTQGEDSHVAGDAVRRPDRQAAAADGRHPATGERDQRQHPWAKVPLYLAGARLLEVFPMLPLIANEPLGVGALSYAGTFNVGVVADRDAYPDLNVFAAGAGAELHALGMSTYPTRDRRPAVDAGDDRALVAQAARPIRSEVTYEQRQLLKEEDP